MKFPENNWIECVHAYCEYLEHIPPGVDFKPVAVADDRIHLTAPGYGGTPHGQGPIVVFIEGGVKALFQAKVDALHNNRVENGC